MLANQPCAQWSGNQCANPNSADGNAEGDGALFLEPFAYGCKRRNVDGSETRTNSDTESRESHREAVGVSRSHHSAGENHSACRHHLARSDMVGPVAGERTKQVARQAHAGEEQSP